MLRDVQRELLLPAAKCDSVRDLELADDAASLIATLQAFLAGMGAERLCNTLQEAQDVKREHRRKEYVPRKFFCKKCNRLGNHSTQHHRSIATIDDKNSPFQGATTQ